LVVRQLAQPFLVKTSESIGFLMPLKAVPSGEALAERNVVAFYRYKKLLLVVHQLAQPFLTKKALAEETLFAFYRYKKVTIGCPSAATLVVTGRTTSLSSPEQYHYGLTLLYSLANN